MFIGLFSHFFVFLVVIKIIEIIYLKDLLIDVLILT